MPDKYGDDFVNEKIRFNKVLLISPTGEKLGVMSSYEAIQKAYEYDLDLICVSPKSEIPVCKILDYSKYKYEQKKKQKESKKKQVIIETKEIQLTPLIAKHDLETKIKAGIKFLKQGNKLFVALSFKGRQLSHSELYSEVITNYIESVSEYGTVEKAPELNGKTLSCVIASNVKHKK